MATYNITKSDGNPGPAIADAASPDTQTDLQLVGQNAVSYGLDVATSFYWLLEHFANTAAPTTGSAGRATGQMWYNTTAGKKTINVYNGATWDEMAPTAQGTVNNATLRFDLASLTWTEETQITVTSAGVLDIAGPTPGNSVSFTHDDTDFNIAGTSTDDINVTGITTVNLPEVTLTTELDETYGGTGKAVYVVGDLLYADTTTSLVRLAVGSNTEVLTLAGGVPTWASGGAAGTVTSSGSPLVNEVAVFTAATDIDSDSTFTWNGTTMFATNVTGTNIGGIASGNLVDKSNTETIAAVWTHTSDIALSTADLTLLDDDFIVFGTGSDLSMTYTAGSFVIDGNGTTGGLFIQGLTGLIESDNPLHVKSTGLEAIRVIGDAATWSSSDSYINFYDSDESEWGLQIGTLNGSGNTVNINSRLGDLELYASNTLMMEFTATTAEIKNTAGVAMAFRNPFTVGTNASTSATVGDINNAQYNVGYNETPTQTIVSSRDIDIDDIGKFLTRTTSTTRTLTVVNDTDIPVGGSCVVHNGQSGGTLSISPGVITLTWVDGSGTVPASATRTIANNSVVTLRKVSSTVWQIWGNGIS